MTRPGVLLVAEAGTGVLVAVVAAAGVAALSTGEGEGPLVAVVAVVALLWAALLVLAARALPSRRGRLGAGAGQILPVTALLPYVEAPGGLLVLLGSAGLAAQVLATPPVRFVRGR